MWKFERMGGKSFQYANATQLVDIMMNVTHKPTSHSLPYVCTLQK